MRILLVEGNDTFVQLFKDCLPKDKSISFISTESFEEGLKIANDFDICVFDLCLPDSNDPADTIRRIQEIVIKPRVICSGSVDNELAYQLGRKRIGFIPKWVDKKGLIMVLSNVIGFFESSQELYSKLQLV